MHCVAYVVRFHNTAPDTWPSKREASRDTNGAAQLAPHCCTSAGPQAAQERFADLYDRVYSVCEDREALLGLLLARKEQFAQQALRGVLRDELAVRSAHFMG